ALACLGVYPTLRLWRLLSASHPLTVSTERWSPSSLSIWCISATRELIFPLSSACVVRAVFFFSSRRRHTRLVSDWSSDVCSSDLALQRLEHSGLVTRTTNIGSAVTRLSPEDLRERVELRAMLEVHAAQQAAPRMHDEAFAELERRLRVMEEAVAANSYYEAAQADLNFRRHIWQCGGNRTLCRHLELSSVPFIAFVSILRSRGLQRLTTVVEAHQPLIDALRSRDPEVIRDTFGRAAVNPYRPFLGTSPDVPVLSAYGFLA